MLFLLPKPFGQIETHKEWIKRIRSVYYRPEDLVATSLPSRARVLIFYWFTPNKSPTPSLFCRRTHWLSLHSLLTLTQRHSHCGTIDTNIKWHIHKHLYRHRHNWYIHRHWQKWCTQRHRHRDIHRLKASISPRSTFTSHWRHPVATGRKNKPVSSKMTIFSFWYGIFCHFVFVFFGNYYLSTPLSLFWWVRGNIYKNILKESRRYTIRLCEPSTLLLLIYFIAKTQAMSSFSQIWEDQWPCWGHFGGQQLLPLWADNW